MLRQCTALFLLLAIMASSFSKAVLVVDFYANQDYIAKNLCVNRDKPMMRCNGRCQLCKRLNHEENQDKSNPERKTESRSLLVFFEEMPGLLRRPVVDASLTLYGSMAAGAPVDRARAIFHPPGC